MKEQKIPFSTIDDYIALQPVSMRAKLEELRRIIKKAAPKATETISYQMPAFKFHGMLAFIAGTKNHYGLYVMPRVLEKFKDKLKAYETSKATIKFPFNKPLPKKLITEIIKYGVKVNLEKAMLKEEAKKKKNSCSQISLKYAE